MRENTSYFMNAQVADSFGRAHPHDAGIHRDERDRVSDPALVETVFCGFSIPEADIHCLNYVWLHPNLRLMSGGAWCWQGSKRSYSTCATSSPTSRSPTAAAISSTSPCPTAIGTRFSNCWSRSG
jgi:hypothetical protein